MKLNNKKIASLVLASLILSSVTPVDVLAANQVNFNESKFESALNRENSVKENEGQLSNPQDKSKSVVSVDEIFKGQKGTVDDPYKITSETQLRQFAHSLSKTQNYKGKFVQLENDIELHGDWIPVGLGEYAFNGHFDGKNHSISLKIASRDNLHIEPIEKDKKIEFFGLFGVLDANSYIENLKLDVDLNVVSDGELFVGGLAGYANGATVNNVEVNGKLTGKTTHKKSNVFVGGIIANAIRQKITNSKSNVDVRVEADGGLAEGGGIMALTNRGLIFNSYSKGKITGSANRKTAEGSTALGGICGVNAGTIANCYATNDIISDCYTGYIGAVTGWITGIGSAYQCYYFKDSTLITDYTTKNKNVIKPAIAVGWMVTGSGVSEEGLVYDGAVKMDVRGLDSQQMKNDLTRILNENLKKSRINLKKGSRTKGHWKGDDKLSQNIFEWTNLDSNATFSDKKAKVVYDKNTEKLIQQLILDSKVGINQGEFYGRSKDKSVVVKVNFDEKAQIKEVNLIEGNVDKKELDEIAQNQQKISGIKNEKLKEAVLKAVEKSKANDSSDYSKLNPAIFAGGKGTVDDPFVIKTENQLVDFAKSINEEENYDKKFVKLNNDVTLTKQWKVAGSQGKVAFKGDFNGNNCTISNMRIGSDKLPANYRFVGLFGNISSGSVHDLNIKDVEIHNKNTSENRVFIGCVCGNVQNGGFIDNVRVNGKINSYSLREQQYLGAIAGQALKSNIINSSADIDIVANADSKDIYAGGLVGINAFGALFNSSSRGEITAKSTLNKVAIGGACGYQSGVLYNVYSQVGLNSQSPTTDVGELIGRATGVAHSFNSFYAKDKSPKVTGKEKQSQNGVGVIVNKAEYENILAVEKFESSVVEKMNENIASQDYQKAFNLVKADNKDKIKLKKWTLDQPRQKPTMPTVAPTSEPSKTNNSTTTATVQNVERIAGKTRELTAIEVSKKMYPGTTDTVILANADNFSDTLSAAPLAKNEKAVILYTSQSKISNDTLNEIKRLHAKNIIIVGGEKSVDEKIFNQMKDNYNTTRIAGENRYETSLKIAKQLIDKTKSKNLQIANGDKFQDALAITNLSNKFNSPVLLVRADTIDSEIIKELKKMDFDEINVAGGEKTITAQTLENIQKLTKAKVNRIAGENRYETSLKIAKMMGTKDKVVLASGEKFQDSLVAAAYCDKTQSVLLLTAKENLQQSTKEYLAQNKPSVTIIGGEQSVSEKIIEQIKK